MWGTHKILQCVLVLLLTVWWYENSWAVSASMQQPCADCHIMHDSQGGVGVAVGGADGLTKVGPQEGLTDATCSGCHNGENLGSKPFVVNLAAAPVYDLTGTEAGHKTLAGGNFHWVVQAGGDLKGHNVVGIGADQTARVPPGGTKTFDVDTPLTCAGTNGCHGDSSAGMTQTKSIWGAHHTNVTGNPVVTASEGIDGSTSARSFRFLDGIVGWEDDDAEFTVATTDHNQYKGVVRVDDVAADSLSISFLCARCHGDFHNGAGDSGVAGGSFGSPWLRHPVDIDMGGIGGEYLQYGFAGVDGDYNVSTPLASLAVTAIIDNVGPLNTASDKAIITCISCHRAHGSPWDYSLRWEYQAWPAAGTNGCGHCHTEKT